MVNSYRITEPHPSVPSSHYIYSGRGGAGNISKVNPKNITKGTDATGPASRVKIPPPSSKSYFAAGRGGAGNMHLESERAIFSFDEELAQQRRIMENSAPVYSVGRGGAGNMVDEMQPGMGSSSRSSKFSRQGSASSTFSSDSDRSATSGRPSLENAWQRLSRSFSRQR